MKTITAILIDPYACEIRPIEVARGNRDAY